MKKSRHRILYEEMQWELSRSTICRHCDRRTLTNEARACLRCWRAMRQNVVHFIVGWAS